MVDITDISLVPDSTYYERHQSHLCNCMLYMNISFVSVCVVT